MDDFYTRTDNSDTEIILEMKLPADVVKSSYAKLLEERGKAIDIKGFRKGNVPTDLVEPSVQQLILSETFERLAPYYVNAAVIKEKLEPIAPPEYTDLKDMSKDAPIEFKVKLTVMPKFKLGDLKKVKVDVSEPEVKDSEIDETIEMMLKNNAANLKEDKKKKSKADDAWAKEIAKLYDFKDVKSLTDLKEKLRELLKEQKMGILRQTAVSDALSQAIKISGIEVPEAGVVYEAQQREDAFMKDLEQMKLSLKDFLTQRSLKLDDLKDRWVKDAKEALETDVLLRLYADKNDVQLEEEELKNEISQIKQSAKLQYEQQHAGHDHESNFDESVYDNPQWQEQIKIYLTKQKAYQQMLDEILGEEFFKAPAQEIDETEREEKEGGKEEKSEKKDGKGKKTGSEAKKADKKASKDKK